MASVEELKRLSILDVAASLGIQLKRIGSHTYSWDEHDSFTINAQENYFNWFARSKGGDVFNMVQVVQEELTGQQVSFKEAKHFLEEGNFEVFDSNKIPEKEPFKYYLEPYETEFTEARSYLKDVRGLSDETIDCFGEKGVLAQATKKTGNYYEPIIVFKSLNGQNKVVGASLQGIRENHDLYERGRLKQIMRASDGLTGMHIDIGQPKRLVFAEAPIDLMSYYELHKGELSDVRLVAMDGLKESTISRHVAELLYELGEIKVQVKPENYSTFLSQTAEVTDFFKDGKHQELITLAVDNDTAGHTFIDRLADKGISFSSDLPSMPAGRDKMDWNDALKESKEKALDRSQEPNNNIGGELINRNSGYLEGEPSRTAPQPEEPKTQPDFPANVQLYFNIERPKKSSVRLRKGYHYATNKDIRFLNRYADDIQKSASWYLQELANSKVTYFYQDKEDVQMLQVNFEKHHWMHLTGIAPVYSDWVDNLSEQFIEDVAAGKGNFANLSLGLGFRDKVKLMPLLPEIFETDSFVFDDLSSVEKMGRLDVANAIRSDDRDVMLAFRTDDSSSFPATLLKPNQTLNVELDALNQEKTILGVFVEKSNEIKTLSVNKEFVVDGGQQMLETLKQHQGIEILKENLSMPENQAQSLRERVEQIQREDQERQQVLAQKEELERDSDGDGIPDAVERNMGTNPYSPDTDGDGKSDQEEISYGSNPLASDNSNNENISSSGQQKTVAELIAAKDSKGLAQVLKEGVKDYFKSDTYKQYLLAMSKFHNYSPLNIQMILRQNSRASYVASFKKWKDEFSRSVNKGEKALRIFAPITVKKRDPKTNEPLLDKDGKEITYTSFKLVPVFDVSQTDGKELPKPVYELKGSYKDYGNLYKSAKEVSEANGVPISFSENTKGAKGYYSPVSNEIVIKKGLSEQHTLKTIFHEMAHSDLHNLEKRAETPFNLSTAELQAESVAFVVSSHYGLDTSEYSFGYLANWTQDPRGLSDLEGQIKIVQKEADSLISRIDQALEKYQSKELTKDAFQQKLDRLKEQSKEQTLESKEKEKAKDEIKKAEKSNNQLNL
ncbi:toprim domain-containing protein [Streptococcus sanguinis]|uniref:PBECR4 domain-containing protein n=1 Tax=Streptococcus sanguinis TaxID=1305 RepID=UPI001CBE7401|nr:PBECR4 domain-containing protein [Streptococcus sanguinis]MBZ2037465.1 toprim domain-containing protein [Streptococcus sanguinis]MBZ2067871.1 toprim domain-containing protein [Streptococcus sanguinis]MBZ2070013.1 toprim domain-containing protein [Streptococcus sanguinis]